MRALVNARIAKLLSLTMSDNDNEALSAIRIANRILQENNTTWIEVLSPESVRPNPVNEDGRYYDVEDFIEEVLDAVSGDRIESFVESVYSFHESAGFVTERQWSALCKIAKRWGV